MGQGVIKGESWACLMQHYTKYTVQTSELLVQNEKVLPPWQKGWFCQVIPVARQNYNNFCFAHSTSCIMQHHIHDYVNRTHVQPECLAFSKTQCGALQCCRGSGRFGSDIFGQPGPEPGRIFLKFLDPQTEPLLTLGLGQNRFRSRLDPGSTQ